MAATENNPAADQKCTGAPCYNCLEKLESKSHLALLVNVIEVPENAKHFKCLDCNQTLTSWKSFLTHRKSHLVCQICGKKCRFPYVLKEHIRIHTGERPHECEFCQKRFRTYNCLRIHIRLTHIGEKQHECEFCKKRFSQKCGLQTHIRIHTGERPYECESCQKSFAHKSSLERHRNIHSRSKSFICNECGKSCSGYGHLSKHINQQHKNYECKDCDETLKSRSEYLEHRQSHKTCGSCEKVFKTPYELQRHIHNSHDASSQNEAITDKKLGLKPVVVLNRIDTEVSN